MTSGGGTSTKKLYIDADRTVEATPQQIYNAYMAGTVLLNLGTSGTMGTFTSIISMTYNGTADNIVGVYISCYDDEAGKVGSISIGDMGGE